MGIALISSVSASAMRADSPMDAYDQAGMLFQLISSIMLAVGKPEGLPSSALESVVISAGQHASQVQTMCGLTDNLCSVYG